MTDKVSSSRGGAYLADVAREGGFLPAHLFGATMHRTLNARLSENIRYKSDRSEFFRTGPSTFFLHSLAEAPDAAEEFKKVYVGHLRSKAIRKENVLVAPRRRLQEEIYGDYVPSDEGVFRNLFESVC